MDSPSSLQSSSSDLSDLSSLASWLLSTSAPTSAFPLPPATLQPATVQLAALPQAALHPSSPVSFQLAGDTVALCPTCHQHTAGAQYQAQPSQCTLQAWPPWAEQHASSCPALLLEASELPEPPFSPQPDPLLDLLDEWGFDMSPIGRP